MQQVKGFFERTLSGSRPFLLALSGGTDSRVLFHILLEIGRPFEAAHLDHGWRPESGEEARALEVLCRAHGVPLHLGRSALAWGKNDEARAREERLRFFGEICAREQLSGVVLAHHADDLAETILKRLFEGASLPKLYGMKEVTEVAGLLLLRPLLKLHKAELSAWGEERGIQGFCDPTNLDPRLLRGRMRTALLPLLSEHFGKNVVSSLLSLGEQAKELEEELSSPTLTLREGPWGGWAEVEGSPLRCAWSLRGFFEERGTLLTRDILRNMVRALHGEIAPQNLAAGDLWVSVERGKLVWINRKIQENKGIWKMETGGSASESSWRELLLSGQGCARLPRDSEVVVDFPKVGDKYPGDSPLMEWFAKNRVPGVLRRRVPLVRERTSGRVVHEFLTGRTKKRENFEEEFFSIYWLQEG